MIILCWQHPPAPNQTETIVRPGRWQSGDLNSGLCAARAPPCLALVDPGAPSPHLATSSSRAWRRKCGVRFLESAVSSVPERRQL